MRSMEQFREDFVSLVSAHDLNQRFGLTRVRLHPQLPRGCAYLESENVDRTLSIQVVPDGEFPGTINAAWYLRDHDVSGPSLVKVQPCAHQVPYEGYDPVLSDPCDYPEFADAFVDLLRRYRLGSAYGLSLVHRHFDMSDDEVLLETPVDAVSATIAVVPRHCVSAHAALVWRVERSRAQGPVLKPMHFSTAAYDV